MDPLLKVAAAVAASAVVAVAVASIGPRDAAVPPTPPTPAYSAALARQIAAQAALAGPNAPHATVQAAGVTLRSVGFDFPTEGRALPPGQGADLVAANCMSCHTPGMILTQPRLTQAEWSGEVTKMAKVYKAPVAEADMPAIVAYLAAMHVGP